MKIAIVGLGYVGSVTGSALASMGNEVTGVDLDDAKVEVMNQGRSPIPEPGLPELIATEVAAGRLSATTSVADGVRDCDCVIISVGTPTDPSTGNPDLSALRAVATAIAEALESRTDDLLIAVASTVPPGTTEGVVRPILERVAGESGRFQLCFLPEFLREGSAIDDFRNPTRFVIGSRSKEEGALFRRLRDDIPDRHFIVATEVAELQKSAENCWHATKVTFANEISRIAEANGIDAHLVMDLLSADDKQNISKAYMRPGFAFGGSCLPKDLRAMVRLARNSGASVPMLDGIASSNLEHIRSAVERIVALGKTKVGILGLAFKAGTDDLRESPAILLAEDLIEKGLDVRIHDYDFNRHSLFGVNQDVWSRHPRLHERMTDTVEDLMSGVEVAVVTQFNRRYAAVAAESGGSPEVLDLSGVLAQAGEVVAPERHSGQ